MSATPAVPERIAALQRKVSGDPAALDAIAKSWRGISDDTDDYVGSLGRAVNTVDEAWYGRSADAFVEYMRKYGKAGEGLYLLLSNAASSLDTAASSLRSAKSGVDGIATKLITDMTNHHTTYFANNKDATEVGCDAGTKPLIDQAEIDAKVHVDKAEKDVSAAKTAIRGFLDGRPLTFAAIPEVAKEEFTPAKGRTIVWEPTEGYGKNGGGAGGPDGGGGGRNVGGYGPSGPPPPAGGGPAPTGQVKAWIDQAIEILRANGVPVGSMNASDIWMIIQHESGGNPHAINLWDSNASAGHPSKGLMQTIDPTFNSYALPGHTNIYDPVDNIIAGVRYAVSRYGSVSNVPGVVGMKTGAGYSGY
ncbi:transglycosylase SLT domain-containing protein [Nonomuraea sp. NPDC050394]|uniref:transglycosylase SLT domain-containing protein n=1 Tax=Nonomuraea sp. NPDC050394 TaxID=3364363 RepID=UPI0037BCB549